jgi:hypothetical protein
LRTGKWRLIVVADKLPNPPRAFPQAEFLREGPNGRLWFVPWGRDSRHGHVYCDPPSGELRRAGGKDLDAPRRPKLVTNRKEGNMPAAAGRPTRKSAKKSKFATALKKDDKGLARFLLANPTYSDATWSERVGGKSRRKGESRSDFIRRVLLR